MNQQAPPYAADTRAKGWRFELDHERIEQSITWALAPSEIRPWLLMLWMTAWKQAPCGSLEADDELIAARIGMPNKLFTKHRDLLLRGWCVADDGRLYHSVITERVLEMVEYREKAATRKLEYRERMRSSRESPEPVPRDSSDDVPRDSTVGDATGTGTGTGTGRKEKRKEKRGDTPLKPPAWVPPAWIPAKEWADFETMRRAMRNVPFTDAARDGVVRELAKFQALGHDPAKLLLTAVTSGHRTVFEPKWNGRATPSAGERDAAKRAARLHEMTGGILGNSERKETPPKEIFDVVAKRLD